MDRHARILAIANLDIATLHPNAKLPRLQFTKVLEILVLPTLIATPIIALLEPVSPLLPAMPVCLLINAPLVITVAADIV